MEQFLVTIDYCYTSLSELLKFYILSIAKHNENKNVYGKQCRSTEYRGQSAITYKSAIRRQLVEEGYRIWGNIGDQWSDLQGDFVGNRTFKLPNPMYFVP